PHPPWSSSLYLCYSSLAPRDLHPFPTRRSSDLTGTAGRRGVAAGRARRTLRIQPDASQYGLGTLRQPGRTGGSWSVGPARSGTRHAPRATRAVRRRHDRDCRTRRRTGPRDTSPTIIPRPVARAVTVSGGTSAPPAARTLPRPRRSRAGPNRPPQSPTRDSPGHESPTPRATPDSPARRSATTPAVCPPERGRWTGTPTET